jgi:hypothetical protein
MPTLSRAARYAELLVATALMVATSLIVLYVTLPVVLP